MRRLLPIVLLVLLASSSVAAKDFHGIRPMHSTREDVIAILGQPLSKESRWAYFLDEGEVHITFADEDFVKRDNCAVAAGTVTPCSSYMQVAKRELMKRRYEGIVPGIT